MPSAKSEFSLAVSCSLVGIAVEFSKDIKTRLGGFVPHEYVFINPAETYFYLSRF